MRELTLQRASDDGLIQLVQIEDSYDLLDGMQFDDFTPEKREKVRDSRIVYGGWAILRPRTTCSCSSRRSAPGTIAIT